jgi:enamine deaminase RidA (YjgF/YER057c/UK114 family)
MTRKRVFSGHRFEKTGGYARAVVEDGWVFHSGTTGFDWATDTIAEDIEGQTRQMLENVKWGLAEAGAALADVVRVRLYIRHAEDDMAVSRVFKEFFGEIYPAETMVVCDLVDPRMLVEMEATARLPEAARNQ